MSILIPGGLLGLLAAGIILSPLNHFGRRLRATPMPGVPTRIGLSISEPSGLAWHDGRGTVLVVSDGGGLYEVDLDGIVLAQHPLEGDLEAVAVHPETGTAFVGDEGRQAVLEYDLDLDQVIRVIRPVLEATPGFEGERVFNKAIEGIAIVTSGTEAPQLWIAWEKWPARIVPIAADLSSGATQAAREFLLANGKPAEQAPQAGAGFKIGARQLSGLSFDSTSGLLLALSAHERTLSLCERTGTVIGVYRLQAAHPEGVCLLPGCGVMIADETRNTLWQWSGPQRIIQTRTKNPPS